MLKIFREFSLSFLKFVPVLELGHVKFFYRCNYLVPIYRTINLFPGLGSSSENQLLLKRANYIDKLVLLTLTGCFLFVGLGYLVVALIKNILNVYHGSSLPFVLPYKAAYFFDMQTSPAFELTFMLHACMSYLSPIISVSC